MSHGWTPKRRKRQAKLIHQWKPWEKSTGPKTEEGKAVSKMNALKHGMRSGEIRAMEALMSFYAKVERQIRKNI